MRIGKLKVEVLRRYCGDEKKKRRGIAYIVQVRARNLVKQFVLTDGEFKELLGDLKQLIGSTKWGNLTEVGIHEHGTTWGGWVTLHSRELAPDEYFEPSEVKCDPVEFAKLLDKHKIMILTSLVKADKSVLDLDWGLWNSVKPLLYTYVSGKVIELPGEAYIEYEPYSFKALFRLRDVKIPVVKARPRITNYNIYTEVAIGKDVKISYYSDQNRAVVLFEDWRKYLYEQYKNREVIEYDLTYTRIDRYRLFYSRLGRLIFEPVFSSRDLKNANSVPKELLDFHVVNSVYKTDKQNVFLTPEDMNKDILVYHNDYGAIVLTPQAYKIKFL